MILGIEIGGTKLQVVTADRTGRIDKRFRYVVNPELRSAGILAQLTETISQLPEPPERIGVGFGGPVDWQTGRIATSHQIGGWAGFNLSQWLGERVPRAIIKVENDANAAALGEARQGVASGFQHVFYVTLGSGVGGSMVVNGQLYHGATPGEAEIGHLWLVPPDGSGGGQTIEQTVSGWAVDKQIRELLPQLPADSVLKRLVQEANADDSLANAATHNPARQGQTNRSPASFLHPAYEQGDPVARMLIEQIGSVLALGLSHVVHLFHPEAIVLGGGLSLIGEPLRAAVRQALPRFVMQSFHPAPIVLLAKLGEDAVPVGALQLIMDDE